jgi:hypothetical protein
VQFGRTETLVLPLTDELRARIQTGNGNQNLGVLKFLNRDGSLNFDPPGVEVFGYEGKAIKIFEGQHLISWALQYTIRVDGGRSYSLVPSKMSYVSEI